MSKNKRPKNKKNTKTIKPKKFLTNRRIAIGSLILAAIMVLITVLGYFWPRPSPNIRPISYDEQETNVKDEFENISSTLSKLSNLDGYLGAMYDSAGLFIKKGEFQKSILYYDKAIDNCDNDFSLKSILLSDKGVALLKLGDTLLAKEYNNLAIQLDSANYLAWGNKSTIHFLLGDIYEALYCIEKVITINPRDYESYYNRGTIYGLPPQKRTAS